MAFETVDASDFSLLLSRHVSLRNNDARQNLRSVLETLALKLPASENSIELIFKALKNPMITIEIENTLLEVLHKQLFDEPAKEQVDLWKLVERAKEKYPNLDLANRVYAQEVLDRRLALASE